MTRGRPRKFDEETALKTALKLFWQHGYEGASIALLAEEMGINTPSLYAAFGNKEDLFLRVVELYSNENRHIYEKALKQPTAREVVKTMLEGEVELVTRHGAPKGCLMIQGALVTSPQSEKLRQMMADMRRMAENWLVERFEKAKQDGDLPDNVDPAGLAGYVMALNSGLAIQAKSGVAKADLQNIVKTVMQGWPH